MYNTFTKHFVHLQKNLYIFFSWANKILNAKHFVQYSYLGSFIYSQFKVFVCPGKEFFNFTFRKHCTSSIIINFNNNNINHIYDLFVASSSSCACDNALFKTLNAC